jgi:hypothetical protein
MTHPVSLEIQGLFLRELIFKFNSRVGKYIINIDKVTTLWSKRLVNVHESRIILAILESTNLPCPSIRVLLRIIFLQNEVQWRIYLGNLNGVGDVDG